MSRAQFLIDDLLSEDKSIRTSRRSPIGIRRKSDTDEYRVGFKGKGNEDSAYYTSDKTDARRTAADMLRRHRVGPTRHLSKRVNGVPSSNEHGKRFESDDSHWMEKAHKDVDDRGTEGVCSGKNFGGPSCRPGTRRYALAKTFKKVAHESVNEDCGHCAKLFTGPPGDVYDAALELTELFGEEEIGVDSHHRDLLLIAEYENLPSTHKAEIERITAKYGLNPTVESASNILAAVNEVKHGAGEDLMSALEEVETTEQLNAFATRLFHEFPTESETVEVIVNCLRSVLLKYHRIDMGRDHAAADRLFLQIDGLMNTARARMQTLISGHGVTP